MIDLPNGESWVNGGENTDLAIGWVRTMFQDASNNSIPIEDHLARGYEVKKSNGKYFHCCIETITLVLNIRIMTSYPFMSTIDYNLETI